MSFPLPSVDLSTAVVGTKGTISLNNVGVSAGGVSANPSMIAKPATLFFFNDSGCGLEIMFKGGTGFNLPAGAWVPVPLPAGSSAVLWRVLYVLPNPPVSLLLLTYYAQGESIPQSMTLGNSPVGIGGSTSNVTNTSLSNEGNAANTLVIDIGDIALAQLWKVWTDHFSVSVDQSGVAHQVLKGNTAGNPLQIGQAGDMTEVLGQLLIDQIPSVSASPPTGTGTITIYELVIGPFKLVAVVSVNLKNTSASQFSLALPTPFTVGAAIYAGFITNTEFLAGGVAQSMQVITQPNAGGASTVSNQTVLFTNNIGSLSSGVDTLRFQANNAATHDGNVLFLVGV